MKPALSEDAVILEKRLKNALAFLITHKIARLLTNSMHMLHTSVYGLGKWTTDEKYPRLKFVRQWPFRKSNAFVLFTGKDVFFYSENHKTAKRKMIRTFKFHPRYMPSHGIAKCLVD